MRIKFSEHIIILLVLLSAVILFTDKAYAGKTWSDQAFSEDAGIAIIGNDDKYETVYAVSIPDKKILWRVGMPKSRGVSINIEGDVVYLVAPEDAGFEKNVKAVNLKTGAAIWEKKLDNIVRKTPVFIYKKNDPTFAVFKDDPAFYFGAELKYRDTNLVTIYAFNKSDGSFKWGKPYMLQKDKSDYNTSANIKEMIPTQAGDFILIVELTKKDPTTKEVKKSIELIKVDRKTGNEVWRLPVTGAFATTPREDGGIIYFVTQELELRENVSIIKRTFQMVSAEDGKVIAAYVFPDKEKPTGDPVFIKGKPIIVVEVDKSEGGVEKIEGKLICFDSRLPDLAKPVTWEYDVGAMPISACIVKERKVTATSLPSESSPTPSNSPASGETTLSPTTPETPAASIPSISPESPPTTESSTGATPTTQIFIATRKMESPSKYSNSIVCISGDDGKLLWVSNIEGTIEIPFLAEEDHLIVGSRITQGEGKDATFTFNLASLGYTDGKELWKKSENGKLENPLLSNDKLVFVMLFNKLDKKHNLIAFDKNDGSPKWKYSTNSVINTKLYIDEDSVDFGTKDGEVVSLGLADGKELYRFKAGSELDSTIVAFKGDLGFATQMNQYFLINDKGVLQKKFDMKPWFEWKKLSILIGCIILSAALWWFIYHARKGKEMFVRRIAGLTAIDEAVGRSTEMGKPVLYITGLADVDDIQTLASLSILGHIAQKTAEYDTPLVVPCCRSVVMSTAQEVVKESYLKAGRPDTYRSENIHYLTDDQFGYVAGVDGIMVREKPAANFYMGKFYAESLILAETGHSTGAIQIAGTAEAAQLPFFVAACDYTLIGEELFAASAYLSKDPLQIGSLKGQDIAKAIILGAIIIGCILMTLDYWQVKLLFATQ